MKKTLLLTAVAALMCFGVANAQFAAGTNVGQPNGINLSWSACDAPVSSLGQNVNVTCASNTAFAPNSVAHFEVAGQRDMVASFIYPGPTPLGGVMDSLGANDMLVDLQTDDGGTNPAPPVPCWWNFTSLGTAARQGAITMATNLLPADGGCGDYWGTLLNGVVVSGFSRNYYPQVGPSPGAPTNRIRLDVTAAASADEGALSQPQPAPGDEVYSFTFRIKPPQSVGTVCVGCQAPVCIVLNQIILYRKNGQPVKITTASSRNWVTWKGGNTPGPCPIGPDATPTKNKTWGSLKTLYR